MSMLLFRGSANKTQSILGTSTPSVKHIEFDELQNAIELRAWSRLAKLGWREFEEAKKYVRSLKILGESQWREFVNDISRPYDIPTHPDRVYKNTGWISWGDWLGTYSIASQKKDFLAFSEARDVVRSMKFKNVKEFRLWKKLNPSIDIPSSPDKYYKEDGWISFSDFMGTKFQATNTLDWGSIVKLVIGTK